ncbi:MAG: DUF4258 domain-containing protein [SAR324 cluster bacterium]|nr:DUF4258 domain-containing protein [SAR324 cluster bacterium]
MMFQVKFSIHALQRMFERNISEESVVSALNEGEVIVEYPDDKPYPSKLILYFEKDIPLHVVVAVDEENQHHYVVTAYIPDAHLWESGFRKRRSK